MEDDLVCEYDSTWDTESDGDELGESSGRRGQERSRRARPAFWSNSSSRNLRAAKDMQNYRHGYPNMIDEDGPEERMPNLKFYLNEIKSSPDDVSIETFHSEWRTDYKRLERVHSYIQWLFPLREPGVNYMATELTKKEIQAFKENEEASRRLVDSYELMLGFYGIQLLNRETGEVKRAENWRERFANLERNMHNNLRITRILKSLGELGFEHYQAPLVRFFLEETLIRKNLSSVKRSVLDYFLFAVRDKRERRKLIRYAFQHFEPKDKFVWCPRKIQKRFKKKVEKRQDSAVGNGQTAAVEEARPLDKSKEGERFVKCIEIQKQSEDDPMSIDFEKQLEGSTDVELIIDGSSVSPSNLNNGSGEMDHTSSAGSNTPKIQEAEEEDVKNSQMVAPENVLHGQDGPKDENAILETNNCSPELSSLRDESENILHAGSKPRESEGSLTVTCLEKTAAESQKAGSPKHVLSLGEPAGNPLRSNADGALGMSDQTEASGDQVRLVDNKESSSTNGVNKQTNGTEKVEPMDTDSGLSCRGNS